MAISADGRTLATASGTDGKVKWWHIPTGQHLGGLPGGLNGNSRVRVFGGWRMVCVFIWGRMLFAVTSNKPFNSTAGLEPGSLTRLLVAFGNRISNADAVQAGFAGAVTDLLHHGQCIRPGYGSGQDDDCATAVADFLSAPS